MYIFIQSVKWLIGSTITTCYVNIASEGNSEGWTYSSRWYDEQKRWCRLSGYWWSAVRRQKDRASPEFRGAGIFGGWSMLQDDDCCGYVTGMIINSVFTYCKRNTGGTDLSQLLNWWTTRARGNEHWLWKVAKRTETTYAGAVARVVKWTRTEWSGDLTTEVRRCHT